MTERQFAEFVEAHVAKVKPLHDGVCLAWWNANVTGSKSYEDESARLESELRKAYSNAGEYQTVKAAQADEPLLARQRHLLSQKYAANQMPPEVIEQIVALEKAIESDFNNHRAEVDGRALTDNDIKDILRNDDDEARRRAAWEGAKQIGARVADRVLELVGIRNEAARKLGFSDFYRMQLELQDIDPDQLFGQLDALYRDTNDSWKRYKSALDERLSKRFGIDVDALRPWHYADPFFQELPPSDSGMDLGKYFAEKPLEELTKKFYDAIGLDIADILARSDLYERDGKSQHAFCINIDRADDVRVLCNVKSDEYWMATMLHEFGHAVYDKYIDRALPFLLREPAHTLLTEAVAMFMGRLTKNAAWLERHAGVPHDEAVRAAEILRRQSSEQLLVFVRWALVVVNFERELYANPSQDLDALWWALVEKFQSVRIPERKAPDWASKIHIATVPAYYQNYILGEMVASQMYHALGTEGDDAMVSRTATGAWFRDNIFKLGNSARWERIVEDACGEAPTPRHLASTLTA